MKDKFLNEEHAKRFRQLVFELDMEGNVDVYWRSYLFILAGDEALFRNRKSLIIYDERSIDPEVIFNSHFSGGEQRILALAYNLFTNMDYYEDEKGNFHYISPLSVFSNLDKNMYELAKNSLDLRLEKK